MHRLPKVRPPLGLLLTLLLPLPLAAADWPMDRHDAARSNAAEQTLAPVMHLQWERQLPAEKRAWPDQPSMPFDAACSPVVMGKSLFVNSTRTDSVTACDTETGAERWTFVADGPVRFAPVAWDGKVYFTSDDGYLYCVGAATGGLLWKYRGGPSDRKVLGNERLISTWPARGGPVLADGVVYFAAGIWPFMGIFIHAVDARTGKAVWTNDGDGSVYMPQPHNADSFAGVAPQGALVVAGDRLLIPGGRSVPACLDRATGKLLHYRLAENAKTGGGSDVAALGNLVFNGGEACDLATGDKIGGCAGQVVLTPDALYTAADGEVRSYDWPGDRGLITSIDRKGRPLPRASWSLRRRGSVALPGVKCIIKAGARLYAGVPGRVVALDLPLRDGRRPSWEAAVEGEPIRLLAGDDRLFVVTRDRIYCHGARRQSSPLAHAGPEGRQMSPRADAWTDKARRILETTHVRDGYCVAWGVGSGRLILELARQSQLHIIAVEADAARVKSFRKELAGAGLYGERVAVLPGTPATVTLPPYLANLMVCESLPAEGSGFVEKAFASLRPYGGVACLPVSVRRRVEKSQLAGAHLRDAGEWLLLSRDGALPESADWTHEHADAANTRVSRDKLVKAPLGVLWFGGTSNDGILPRHGHGPQPQVIDGRVIIEGVDMMRALDLYTGRLLWQTDVPGVGKAYNNTSHQPGANAGGSNFVSASDGIYVAAGNVCLRLDPATGRPAGEFRFPAISGESDPVSWSHVSVAGEYLIGGGNVLSSGAKGKEAVSSSRYLAVLNRHTGRLLWTATAHSGFRHNAVCIGGGRLYVIDRPSADHLARLRRRGEALQTQPRLVAFDIATGREAWSSEHDIFGTWLSYSAKYDVLVEAGRNARDTLSDEPSGMRAYHAGKGTVLWQHRDYSGPAMIHGDIILKDRGACELLSGVIKMRTDPLTGLPAEWLWSRNYGCNTPLASEHLLTFRSGAAGYYDLCNDGGTGNLGGFRSSCTNNLIVAGGVLVAPDYTRTCTCQYQNQTSLALVHMPEAEMWTFQGSRSVNGPIRRLGVNLGAPGDRKAVDGTLWLEYPSVGGPSPAVPIRHEGEVTWFRHHSSRVEKGDLPWVEASGAKGLRSLTIALDRPASRERVYTVRLHFLEPETGVGPGRRVFDVALQGKAVLRNLDVVREAGGTNRAIVKEFHGVRVAGDLTVTLTPAASASLREPILCGVEVVAEGW